MSFTAGSLEDVEAWANREFPEYFAELDSVESPIPIFEMVSFDGEYVDGKIVLQSILVPTLEVGSTAARCSVYARISGNNDVELFSYQEVVHPGSSEKLGCMKPVVGLVDVVLHEPLSHPVETGHPAGVDRLETLIRYIYLKNGEPTAVQPKLGFFKTHFRAACRDVARGVGLLMDGDDTDESDTLPGDFPPDLVADTDIAGLRDQPAATSVYNQHVHAMDESYHDFKTKMLSQLGTMQAIDRSQIDHLQAQVQSLERRLTKSEECRTKVEKELEAEKEKTKTTAKQSADWKSQYDGLKGTLERVLGQRF
ncbi:hypothetical protein EKO04_007478 [Ascochyta lentis]|uniref:Uncharacterized protein n=1 Tax=Ascochyta lentis TaxID=205686 RepID=A0A8H7J1F4_9PLEO|nr:hypothetical protein EKO04_007478 [Ascochyta lentis]